MKLNSRHLAGIALEVSGVRPCDIAATLKVSSTTLHKWRSSEAWQAEVDARVSERFDSIRLGRAEAEAQWVRVASLSGKAVADAIADGDYAEAEAIMGIVGKGQGMVRDMAAMRGETASPFKIVPSKIVSFGDTFKDTIGDAFKDTNGG